MRILRIILISVSGLLIAFNVLYLFELITGRYNPGLPQRYRFTIYAAPVCFLLFAWLLLYFAGRIQRKMKKRSARRLVDSLTS